MSNKVIGDYDAAISIDGSTNFLLIQPGSSSTQYNKINRNVFLGVTGQPMDISTSQNVTNKTLNNSNILTIRDDRFTLQDSGDTTKQAQFQLSGLTTATTRTYTLPDRSSTIVTLDGAQTFTGANSFTGSSWSGGTIDNSTVTVNAISGHTTANTGTVYGAAITAGVINSAALLNSVNAAAIQSNAVLSGKLGLSSGFTGGVATQANAGTAGGNMFYINLGGLKMLWGLSTSLSLANSTSATYTWTLPTSFFSATPQVIQPAIAVPGTATNSAIEITYTLSSSSSITTQATNQTGGTQSISHTILVIGT